jgi:hypothetical protein
MTAEERDLINGLFERLKNVPAAQRDAEAEQLIGQQVAAMPESAYYLVQTLLVQEHALQNAQLRINQLQHAAVAASQAPAGGGGFLSGLLHRSPPAAPPPLPGFPTTGTMGASAGGGFLRSALATAAGVAGGSLLFQGIEDLLGHRSGAFGPMLGGMGGFGGMGGGMMPADNVDVTNNYYNDPAAGAPGQQTPVQEASFLPAADENTASAADQAPADDPGLGVDWGSNIDPGPAPDAGDFDNSGGPFDSGNMAV